jgi:ABC-type sugar transport system permease subunit
MAVTAQGWQRRRAGRKRIPWLPYAFVLPAVVIFAGLMAIPMIGSIVLSFESWDGLRPARWVGLTNYWNLLHDDVFLLALQHTAIFVLSTVVLQTIIPLLVASLLNSGIRGSALFRTIYFMPVVISLAITGLLWSMIYEPNFGVLNTLLGNMGLHGLTRFWLSDNTTVLPSIITVSIWQSLGFFVVIFFAGLQNIPQELYESAALDGANAWQRLTRVTVPLLAPVTTVVVVLNTIGGIQVFDQVFVLTSGGPNHASETLGTYLYLIAFGSLASSVSAFGYAAAIGIVILVMSLILSVIQIRWGRAREIEY